MCLTTLVFFARHNLTIAIWTIHNWFSDKLKKQLKQQKKQLELVRISYGLHMLSLGRHVNQIGHANCWSGYQLSMLSIGYAISYKFGHLKHLICLNNIINNNNIVLWSGMTNALLQVSWSVVVPRLHLHS